ncbi:MAG TPA: Rrf2 family transcriptional regulator [Brumimicrobium sp.]|nr:Rrf2 family transcriptional regulator [Brumimicrobium sp.]
MFSKACEYGIRACVIVAQYSMEKERISLKDISKAIHSPEAFTSKILQKLVKNGLIISVQGAYGGFEVTNKMLNKINLQDIVDAIDGKESYNSCVLGLKECSDCNPCPAHKKYKFIKEDLTNMLKTTTVKEMVEDTQKGLAFLRNAT